MKTEQEVVDQIHKLAEIRDLDASGMFVKLVTLVALEWVLDPRVTAPSERLVQVSKEAVYDGTIDIEGGIDGE